MGHFLLFLHAKPRNNTRGGAEQEPRKEEVRVRARPCALGVAVRRGERAAVSGLMEKVSANGSLTPRRGHLGRKYAETDQNGNLDSAQVRHNNAAFIS